MIITTNPNPKVQVLMSFKGGDGNYTGYNFGEYFPGLDIHQDFASKEEAEEELSSAYAGADCEGVEVAWEVAE